MVLKNKKIMITGIAAFLAIVLVVTAIVLFVPTTKKICGTWQGSWEINGRVISRTLVLKEDGTWISTKLINGSDQEVEYGYYTIEGIEIFLWYGYKTPKGEAKIADYIFGKVRTGGFLTKTK